MKHTITFAALLFFGTISHGQPIKKESLRLRSALSSVTSSFEFSSMAWWKNTLLLVPAMKKDTPPGRPEIYTIHSDEIGKGLRDSTYKLKYDTIRIDESSFKACIGKRQDYDGIEATVVIGGNIYFSIETKKDNDKCYIAKGHIDTSKPGRPKIVLDDYTRVQKPPNYPSDGGFESLVYLENENKLMTVFEYSSGEQTLFYKMNPDLKITDTGYLPMLRASKLSDLYPEKNRMPDLCFANNKLIGINGIFLSESNSYSQLISFGQGSKEFKKLGEICDNNCPDNWEGIVPFKKGWLMINDNRHGEHRDTTRLIYVELPSP